MISELFLVLSPKTQKLNEGSSFPIQSLFYLAPQCFAEWW